MRTSKIVYRHDQGFVAQPYERGMARRGTDVALLQRSTSGCKRSCETVMGRLTKLLLLGAAAVGLLVVRNRGRAEEAEMPDAARQGGTRGAPDGVPAADGKVARGMVVMRNDHIDDGMVVRSPFQGDPGMVRKVEPGGEPR